jgi:hypothetical protein
MVAKHLAAPDRPLVAPAFSRSCQNFQFPALLVLLYVRVLLYIIYIIQVYRAKNEFRLQISLDGEIVLCNYSRSAVTALNLAAALAVRW